MKIMKIMNMKSTLYTMKMFGVYVLLMLLNSLKHVTSVTQSLSVKSIIIHIAVRLITRASGTCGFLALKFSLVSRRKKHEYIQSGRTQVSYNVSLNQMKAPIM